jgi:hypothetical protein
VSFGRNAQNARRKPQVRSIPAIRNSGFTIQRHLTFPLSDRLHPNVHRGVRNSNRPSIMFSTKIEKRESAAIGSGYHLWR